MTQRHAPLRSTRLLRALERIPVRSSVGSPPTLQPRASRDVGMSASTTAGVSASSFLHHHHTSGVAVRFNQRPTQAGDSPPPTSSSAAGLRKKRRDSGKQAGTSISGEWELSGFSDFIASDSSGTPRTKDNGPTPMRSLPSLTAAEEFFFKNTGLSSEGGEVYVTDSNADDDGRAGSGNAQSEASRIRKVHVRETLVCRLCNEDVTMSLASYGNGGQEGTGASSGASNSAASPSGGSSSGPGNPQRFHIVASSRASHTNHSCREVVLDSLALLCRRGYPIDSIMSVWINILLRQQPSPSFLPAFHRLEQFSQPQWSLAKRMDVLGELLHGLKDMGVIDISLAVVEALPTTRDDDAIATSKGPQIPSQSQSVSAMAAFHHRRRVAFERLEYIGDNSWGSNISNRMMLLFPDRQWLYSQSVYSFNCFRDAIEMNVNLGFMFDRLHIEQLFSPSAREKLGSGKMKADVIEALIGELQTYVWGLEPQLYDSSSFVEINGNGERHLLALIHHCLTEIYDLIVLSYVDELSHTAIPLAKELAAQHIWRVTKPNLTKQKDRIGFLRRQRQGSTTSSMSTSSANTSTLSDAGSTAQEQRISYISRDSVMYLPPQLGLHSSRTVYPERVPNPLLEASARDEDTWNAYTDGDAFANFIDAFHQLDLIQDKVQPMYLKVKEKSSAWRTLNAALGSLAYTPPAHWATTTAAAQKDASQQESEATLATTSVSVETKDVINDWNVDSIHSHAVVDDNYDVTDDLDLPSVAAFNPDDAYFRDPYFDLSSTPQGNIARLGSADSVPTLDTLGVAKRCAYPFLLDSPSFEGGYSMDGSGLRSAASMRGDKPCLFAPSRFVPLDVKPPSAGVITDRNLHFGTFFAIDAQEKRIAKERKHASQPTSVVDDTPTISENELDDSLFDESQFTDRTTETQTEKTDTSKAQKEDGGTEPPLEEEGKRLSEEEWQERLRVISAAVQEWWTTENKYFPTRLSMNTKRVVNPMNE